MMFSSWSAMRLGICWILLMCAGWLRADPLPLATTRTSPFDLAVIGRIAGVPAGETRYVARKDLRALPTSRLHLTGEFVKGDQEVTVVFLTDLWSALPRGAGVDTLLATCGDGYASVYRESFLRQDRPFLVLEINGQGPEHWPPPGLKFNPGPYVIALSSAVAPAVAGLLDPAHKRPWGVTTLELANYDERYADSYRGKWAKLSTRAQLGREIWVNSCASCHAGPGTTFGGTKSGQPFAVVQAIAGYNPDLFRQYIRAPKSVNPQAKMEAHPHYTDDQLAALAAFVGAEQP
jgi:mono/diheme cytochrome c family protein